MNSISIIGAGIGGLTLANVLKQQHLDFTLYEAAPAIQPVGAGIIMAINAMQVFDVLGLKEEIEQAGNRIHAISITDEQLRCISKTNALKLEKKYHSGNIAIHRADLQRILAENAGSENIRLNHSLQQIRKEENYVLEFGNGTVAESKIVFGADGIKSKVRNLVLQAGILRNAGQKCWRGLTTFDLPESFCHEAIEIWGKGKRFGFVKIARDKVYWYALVNEKHFDAAVSLPDYFRDFHPLVLELLASTPQAAILRNDITDLSTIPQWYTENLCLIGDAAHATTPNMGQGACQAIEDSYIIGQLMKNENDLNAVFRKFQSVRRKKVDHIVRTSWQIGKLSQWEKGNAIRNFIMRLIPEKINQRMIEKVIRLEQ